MLWKAEGAGDAMPPTPYVETATDREARRLSKACDVMHDEIETMRGDGTPTAVIQAHERAFGRLHTKLVALHDPAAARLLAGETDTDKPSERTDEMTTQLHKRAIGRDGATPAPGSGGRDVEASDTRLSAALADIDSGLARLKAQAFPPPSEIAKHEAVKKSLELELFHLHHPEVAAARVEAAPPVVTSVERVAAHMQKSDHTLSAAEAFRQAMRDPQVLDEYFAQSGTARPVPPTRHGLAKAAGDTFAEHGASVDARASALERSGLSPTEAYRQALSAAGVYATATAA